MTPVKYNAVIADTSCFILLEKIEALFILQQLFDTITVTPEVADEFGKPLMNWVKVKQFKNVAFFNSINSELIKVKQAQLFWLQSFSHHF